MLGVIVSPTVGCLAIEHCCAGRPRFSLSPSSNLTAQRVNMVDLRSDRRRCNGGVGQARFAVRRDNEQVAMFVANLRLRLLAEQPGAAVIQLRRNTLIGRGDYRLRQSEATVQP